MEIWCKGSIIVMKSGKKKCRNEENVSFGTSTELVKFLSAKNYKLVALVKPTKNL